MLRIISAGSVLLVNKQSIKTIEAIRNDSVRLNIGEATLKNIVLRYTDVTKPAGISSAAVLRDVISNMVQTGNTNLVDIYTILGEIKTAIGNLSCNSGPQTKVDDTNPLITYYGFAAAGVTISQPLWSIRRETKQEGNDIATVEWADGDENFDNRWDDRQNLFYKEVVINQE